MNLLVQDTKVLKNTMKNGIRLVILIKKGMVVNQCIMINTFKLK